ncbi:MAG: hypothetical protein ACRDN6_03675 [Gaiellaceae bacterium]
MLRVEVIIGLIAASLAILGFMARAWANIRRGRRIKRYANEIGTRTDSELRRMQEELQAAENLRARKRKRRGKEGG